MFSFFNNFIIITGLIRAYNTNRPQKTSRLEWRFLGFDVCLSEALFWREFFVADDSVDPVVCDFDFELVSLGADCIRDFNMPGSRPDDTEILAIQPYAGDATQRSEVEEEGDSVQCSVFSVQYLWGSPPCILITAD